jgi:hypothetical protein
MKAIKSTHFTDYIQIIYEQFTKKNSQSKGKKQFQISSIYAVQVKQVYIINICSAIQKSMHLHVPNDQAISQP